jgi:hypothetical protein
VAAAVAAGAEDRAAIGLKAAIVGKAADADKAADVVNRASGSKASFPRPSSKSSAALPS